MKLLNSHMKKYYLALCLLVFTMGANAKTWIVRPAGPIK
jgi:hypothetical protein